MKSRSFSAAVIFACAVILFSCGGSDPKPTIQEVQLKKLAKTWTLTTVTLDGVNKKSSTEYNNFKLNLSGTFSSSAPDAEYNYSVSGRPQLSAWPGSGKWKFSTSAPETTILRDNATANELNITYTLNGDELTLTYTYSGDGYTGRTSIVQGQWEMKFN